MILKYFKFTYFSGPQQLAYRTEWRALRNANKSHSADLKLSELIKHAPTVF